jgi:hypothetical protein
MQVFAHFVGKNLQKTLSPPPWGGGWGVGKNLFVSSMHGILRRQPGGKSVCTHALNPKSGHLYGDSQRTPKETGGLVVLKSR